MGARFGQGLALPLHVLRGWGQAMPPRAPCRVSRLRLLAPHSYAIFAETICPISCNSRCPSSFTTPRSRTGRELPTAHGVPLRMRVARQLGYKSVKFLSRITVVDSVKNLGSGQGSPGPDYGYSWYAGI